MKSPKYLEQLYVAYNSFLRVCIETDTVDIETKKYYEECWKYRDEKETKREVKIYKEYANRYLMEVKVREGLDSLAYRCHQISQNFVENMYRMKNHIDVTERPLLVTIGNVKYAGEYLYKADIPNLEKRFKFGAKSNTPIDFHVWITLPDLSIIDLTLIVTSLVNDGQKNISSLNVTTWREDQESKYEYEPLFLHNNLMSLIE